MPITEFDRAWLRGQGLNPDDYEEVHEQVGAPLPPPKVEPKVEKKGWMSQLWDAANYPFIKELTPNLIPRVTPSEVSQAFGQGPAGPLNTPSSAVTGLINAGGNIAASMVTPLNIGAMGLPLLGKLPGLGAKAISAIDKASRLASAGFAADLGYHLPEQKRQIEAAANAGDISGVVEGSAGLGASGLFGAGMVGHAIKGTGLKPKVENPSMKENIGGGEPRTPLQLPEKTESTLLEEQYKTQQDKDYGQWIKDQVEARLAEPFYDGPKVLPENLRLIENPVTEQEIKYNQILKERAQEQLGKQLTPSEYQKIINETVGVDPNVNLINQDLNLMRPSHRNYDPKNLIEDKKLEKLYKKPIVTEYNVEKPKVSSELEPYLVENERFKAKMEKIPTREIPPQEVFESINERLFDPLHAERVTPEEKAFYAEYLGGTIGDAWWKLKKQTSGLDIPVIGEEVKTEPKQIITPESQLPTTSGEIIPSTTIEKSQSQLGRELPTKYSEEFPGQELRQSESPSVVTSEMRRELSKLGWSDAAIEKMSPQTAKLNLDEQAGPGRKGKSNLEKVETPTIESFLKLRKTTLARERELYQKEIGLTDYEAERLQKALAREGSIKRFEDSIGPEKTKKLNAFFEGPLNQKSAEVKFWDSDSRFNPEEIIKETDVNELANAAIRAVQDLPRSEIEQLKNSNSVTSDRALYAALAVERFKKLGGNVKDLALAVDRQTTKTSGSMETKAEMFKVLAEDLGNLFKPKSVELPKEPVRGKGMKIKLGSKEGAFLNLPSSRDYSPESLNLPEEKYKVPSNITSPQIDVRVRSSLGNFGNHVANAFMKFHDYMREYTGKYENKFEQLFRDARESKFTPKGLAEAAMGNLLPEDKLTLHNILMEAKRTGRVARDIPEKFRPLVEGIHQLLTEIRQEQNRLRIPVKEGDNYRLGHQDPTYYPESIASNVINDLTQNPASERVKQLKKDFIEYQQSKGKSPEVAQRRLKEVLDSFQSSEEGNLAAQFGAIDKAEGYGVPDSWVEKDPFVNLRRYARRVGRRFSYFKSLENDPIMREALGINTDVWGNPTPRGQLIPGTKDPVFNIRTMKNVEPVLRTIEGRMRSDEVKYDTISSVGRGFMLGPITALGNLTSSQFLGFQHVTLGQVVPAKIEALKNFSSYLTKSLESGSNRRSIGSLITNENALHDPIVVLRNVRDVWNNVTGASMFESMQRGFNFGEGSWLARDNYLQLLNGKRGYQALKFFKDFAPDQSWKEMIQRRVPELPEDYRNKMAAKYLDSVQGTYTLENLPRFAVEGPLAPLFQLSRWSIEKSNNFQKYVVNPALNGNFQPLMMATIGMLVGGVAMQQILQMVTGKKDKAASVAELEQAWKDQSPEFKTELMYKLMSLASIASYGGILSQVAKDLVETYRGGQVRGVENPLLSSIADSIKLTGQAMKAVEDGEQKLPTIVNLISEILSRNVQLYRLIIQNAGEETGEKIERQNRTRDMEMYQRLHGEEVKLNPARDYNPFEVQMIRKFKQTEDPREAAKLLPDIAKQIVEKNRFTPEKIEGKLRGLGNIPLKYVPNPEREPEKFTQYIMWIAETQGKDTARELLRQYAKQLQVNEVKKEMVR